MQRSWRWIADTGLGRLFSNVLDVLLILLVAFLIALKFREYFNSNFILILVAPLYILRVILRDQARERVASLNLLDLAVSLVVLSEGYNYFRSTYRPNSFLALAEILFLFLFYWLVRLNLTREYQRITLFVFLTLAGVFMAGVAFSSFPEFYAHLRTLGFNDVTSFRNYIYMFNPIGLSIGEWCTVFLLLLPFPLILIVKFKERRYVRWLLTLAVTAILLALVLTFIRGVYIAAAVFFIVGSALFWFYRIFPLRKIAGFNLAIILLLVIGIVPVWRPTLVTLSLFRTTSQVRSFEGRKKVWKDSLRMFEDYPLSGVGASNFTMKYGAYRTDQDEGAFALRPFNFFLQIAVERGLVGLFAYGFLLLSFLFVSYKKLARLQGDVYRKSMILLFVTAVVSVLVRDLSESSIFINRGVGVLLWSIFANVAGSEEEVST